MIPGFHVTADTLLSFAVFMVIFYGIPWVVVEFLIWRFSKPAERKGALWFRILCFLASAVAAGLWVVYLFGLIDVEDATKWHFFGVVLTGIIGMGLLTYLGLRKIRSRVAVTLIVAFYSMLGIGVGFGIYGSSTDYDESEIWVIILMFIAACSLVGCAVSAVLMVWTNSRLIPEGSRPKPA